MASDTKQAPRGWSPPRLSCVLDASALLAFLQGEPGAERVAEALARPAAISAINYAEALGKLAEDGETAEDLARRFEAEGFVGGVLEVEAVLAEDAPAIAALRRSTRHLSAPGWKYAHDPGGEKRAGQGRRERSYPEDTGATEDADRGCFAAGRARAYLRPGALSLSLGDLACLALALRLRLPVMTADRAWEELGLEVEVEAIR